MKIILSVVIKYIKSYIKYTFLLCFLRKENIHRKYTRRIHWEITYRELSTFLRYNAKTTRYSRLFPPSISISSLQMSKQKRRRKELAGKKGDANGRSRSSLDFRVQTLGCQFIFSFYIKIHEYFILFVC